MHSIKTEPSNYTPRVNFDVSGKLILKGRSLMLNASAFYDPLITWSDQLVVKSVHLTVDLDYINTSSSKKLLELLNILDRNVNIQEFIVYWCFESDDEDILLKGQILEDRLKKARFYFTELAGV